MPPYVVPVELDPPGALETLVDPLDPANRAALDIRRQQLVNKDEANSGHGTLSMTEWAELRSLVILLRVDNPVKGHYVWSTYCSNEYLAHKNHRDPQKQTHLVAFHQAWDDILALLDEVYATQSLESPAE